MTLMQLFPLLIVVGVRSSRIVVDFSSSSNQTRSAAMSKTMAPVLQKKDLSALLPLLFLIVLLASVLSCFICHMRVVEGKPFKIDRALEKLRIVADRAISEALSSRESDDWRRTLKLFRELRKDEVRENHPLYATLVEQLDGLEAGNQLQSLFAEFSKGDEHMSVNQISMIFTNMRIQITHSSDVRITPEELNTEPYWWFAHHIQQDLTYSMFLSVFVLFWLAWFHRGIIIGRGDGTSQAGQGENVMKTTVNYHVEINDHVACTGTWDYGDFQRGSTKFTRTDWVGRALPAY